MPELHLCSMTHIRDVLSGRKDYYYTHEIKPINLPDYEELSTNNIYSMISANPIFNRYVPHVNQDKYEAEDAFDHTWLVNLINTIDGRFFPSLIDCIQEQRFAHGPYNGPRRRY